MKGRLPKVSDCVCGGHGRLQRGEVGWYVRCEFDPGFASATEYSTPKRAANAWSTLQEQMDGLSRDAVCAYHAGKTYGQYIAGIPVELPPEPPESVLPETRCVCCGLLIPEGSRSKRYCSPACAERYREEQQRLRRVKAEGEEIATPVCGLVRNDSGCGDERPKCKECGKQIPLGSKRLKYCCGECADKAMARQQRDSARRIRSRRGYL